ncbi:hypothetical protein F5144DRAFT_564975 [Chaetomium tenue]|uniref:Uncharacterized protein n=1 Tax=Chaetomium tenue TaxID=1854479 RepID=A0ACB7PIN9_9PEZI|nr:hypothetical protein F5144DRAFT_564975 [Chaetomium globosum]
MYAAVCGTQAFYGESVISCVTACLGTAPGETATGWRGSGVVKEEAFDEAFVKVLGRVRAKKEEAVKGGGLEEGGSLVADVMEEVLLVRLGYVAGYEVWGWGDVEEGEEAERSEKSWLGLWQRGLDSGCKRYMEREDIRLFADLLGKMFRWRPDERASIEEVLEHPWIRDAPGWESELACRPSLCCEPFLVDINGFHLVTLGRIL